MTLDVSLETLPRTRRYPHALLHSALPPRNTSRNPPRLPRNSPRRPRSPPILPECSTNPLAWELAAFMADEEVVLEEQLTGVGAHKKNH